MFVNIVTTVTKFLLEQVAKFKDSNSENAYALRIGKFYWTMLLNSVVKALAVLTFLIKIISPSNIIILIVKSFFTQKDCAKYLEYKGVVL